MSNPFYDDEGGLRPWVTYSAIGAAVLIGAVLLYGAWIGGDRPQEVNMKCITEGCTYESSRSLKVGEAFPMKCPDCRKDSVVPAFRCSGCDEPVVLNEIHGRKPPTICPKCGEEVWYGR